MPKKVLPLFYLFFTITLPIFGEARPEDLKKSHTLYLTQIGEVNRGIQLYEQLVNESGKHDFNTLEQIGRILLTKGSQSNDDECRLLSMYGAAIAGIQDDFELFACGMDSKSPLTQMATIQFLSQTANDRAELTIMRAFSSPYLPVRMEAAYALAKNRSVLSTGIIDSLMQRLPPPLRVYFPDLFAMIGTQDAIGVLSRLIGDRELSVRLASILAAAKYGRDDFLQTIRAGLTHSLHAEQEACASAVGFLKDSHATSALKKLAESQNISVQLAACRSLLQLGETGFREKVLEAAKHKVPAAILMLGEIEGTTPLLTSLLENTHFQVRIHAALALLQKRESACLPTLIQMVIKSEKDYGYVPTFSLGRTLLAWKVIPSCNEYAKKTERNIPAITLGLKESILRQAIELPEEDFLRLARAIFNEKQNDLVPLLIRLLENLHSKQAIALLLEQSTKAGAPFTRNYCHLALYRLNIDGSHRRTLFNWLKEQKNHELIRFRPLLSWTERTSDHSSYLLTPEETSSLMIETFETLAERHDMEGIHLLLDAIRHGNPKNRYALAGLLLKTIQ